MKLTKTKRDITTDDLDFKNERSKHNTLKIQRKWKNSQKNKFYENELLKKQNLTSTLILEEFNPHLQTLSPRKYRP